MGGVFICYRRADSNDITGRLYDRLVERVGKRHVFKDVFSIEPGERFDERIRASLAKSDVLLLVIGDRWDLSRLAKEDDPVRREIELAFSSRLRVIPLFVRGARMPSASELPESVRRLAFSHGLPLRDDPDFDNDVQHLLRSLRFGTARRWLTIVAPVALVLSLTGLVGRQLTNHTPPKRGPGSAVTDASLPPPRPPPPGMVWIPPTRATIGSTDSEIQALRDSCETLAPPNRCAELTRYGFWQRETPQRQVDVDGFFLDRAEVTFRDFARWLDAAKATVRGDSVEIDGVTVARTHEFHIEGDHFVPPRGAEALPVIDVTWASAMRFCDARGATLPTGTQWERAARGTWAARFPWGNEPPGCADAILARALGCPGKQIMEREGTGRSDHTVDGVNDMVGNVSEWTRDRGPTASEHEVRGGSFASVWVQARAPARRFVDGSASDVGFRCAVSPSRR